jgi:hypothetical protein
MGLLVHLQERRIVANQMIALQARAPQGNPLGSTIQASTQMVNLMRQQQALDRQTAAAEQSARLQQSQEGRAVVEERRKSELHPFAVSEAQSKSTAEKLKTGMAFNEFIYIAASNANSPEDFTAFAQRIAAVPEFQNPMFRDGLDQVVNSIPQDPAQFAAWKKETGVKTIDANERYKNILTTQNTSTGTRQISTNPYGAPNATVVPGSETDTGTEVTYVKGANGEVIPVPKRMGGAPPTTAYSPTGAPRGLEIEQLANQLNPGVVVSGRARTPARNAEVGGVPNSYHLSDNARDFVPGKGQTLATLASSLQPLKAQGFDVIVEGDHVHVEPSRRGTAGGGGGMGQPIPGTGTADKPKELTVSEQTSTYNIKRLLRGAQAISTAVEKDPSANMPSGTEAFIGNTPLISRAVNFTRGAQRQIVSAAQRDILDALLYLATGAAYNKEQLEGQMESYIPAYSDEPAAIESKRQRLSQLVLDAKSRAGKGWTPEVDAAAKKLFGNAGSPSGKRTTPSGVDRNNPLLKGM